MAKEKNEVAKNQEQNVDMSALKGKLGGLQDFRAGSGEEITGYETLDRSDFKLPALRLIQKTSAEADDGVPPGHFYNTVTGKHAESVLCHLLYLSKTRTKWKQPFKRGEDPLCKSFDGKVNTDNTKACAKCQDQSWDNLPDGQSKPSCLMSYTWLGVTADGKQPFRFTAGGKSVGTTKNFINETAPQKLPPFVYKVKLGSQQQKNDSGTFYVATYEIVDIIDKSEFESFQKMTEGMKDTFFADVKTSIETAEMPDDNHEEGPETKEGKLF